MRPQVPSDISNQDALNKSVNKTLNGNLSPGTPTSFDVTGYPKSFDIDNMGQCIRIGSVANPNALPNAWTANNTDLTIKHDLHKVPFGVIVIFKTAPADVYFGTIPPTDTKITLQTTNDTTDTTVWILA